MIDYRCKLQGGTSGAGAVCLALGKVIDVAFESLVQERKAFPRSTECHAPQLTPVSSVQSTLLRYHSPLVRGRQLFNLGKSHRRSISPLCRAQVLQRFHRSTLLRHLGAIAPHSSHSSSAVAQAREMTPNPIMVRTCFVSVSRVEISSLSPSFALASLLRSLQLFS